MKPEDYLNLPYSIITKKITDESGSYYHASVKEFSGCQTTGDTLNEVYENIYEAMAGWIETKVENGFSGPMPEDDTTYSGKFLLRLPKSLHRQLAVNAENEGVSLNQYVLYRLS